MPLLLQPRKVIRRIEVAHPVRTLRRMGVRRVAAFTTGRLS